MFWKLTNTTKQKTMKRAVILIMLFIPVFGFTQSAVRGEIKYEAGSLKISSLGKNLFLSVDTGRNASLYIDRYTGNIGIGNEYPSNKLEVTGTGSFDWLKLKSITESKKAKILYYDPATKLVTFGDSSKATGSGGGGSFKTETGQVVLTDTTNSVYIKSTYGATKRVTFGLWPNASWFQLKQENDVTGRWSAVYGTAGLVKMASGGTTGYNDEVSVIGYGYFIGNSSKGKLDLGASDATWGKLFADSAEFSGVIHAGGGNSAQWNAKVSSQWTPEMFGGIIYPGGDVGVKTGSKFILNGTNPDRYSFVMYDSINDFGYGVPSFLFGSENGNFNFMKGDDISGGVRIRHNGDETSSIGINVNPRQVLDVVGDGIISGKLGIGTTNPGESIETTGNAKITKSVLQTAIPGADHSVSGSVITLTAGDACAIGDVVYLNSSGNTKLCKADAIATCPYVFAICADASISGSASGNFLTRGSIRDDTWTWTAGGLIYVSTTGTTGQTLTQTAPTEANNVVVPVGVALSADVMYFFGNMNTIERK